MILSKYYLIKLICLVSDIFLFRTKHMVQRIRK
jgi:hypothetical protein